MTPNEPRLIHTMPALTADQIVKLGEIAELASDIYAATKGNAGIWDNRELMRMHMSQRIREGASLMHLKIEGED